MQLQDFNGPSQAEEPSLPDSPPPSAQVAASGGSEDRPSLEIALLKAQVEHLELVVETARSLMTSNQERLLRRLHDVPREMALLAARLDRLDHAAPPAPAMDRLRGDRLRRVA
jgi:hypothetical protein